MLSGQLFGKVYSGAESFQPNAVVASGEAMSEYLCFSMSPNVEVSPRHHMVIEWVDVQETNPQSSA